MTQHPFFPSNANFFCADAGLLSPDQLPPPISLRCPHCRQLGSFPALQPAIRFSKLGSQSINKVQAHFAASIRHCPNRSCGGLLFVILDENGRAIEVEPPELLDFDPENLPPPVLSILKEAVACHAAGAYRAAAMMVRRLLEEICELNGIGGATLHQRLEGLKQKIVLPQDLFDAMHELKALGNDAAHIEAKAYDNIGKEEASDSIELAKEILKALYQLRALLARLQARKASS